MSVGDGVLWLLGLQLASGRGARCYVAVAGGLATPSYLGSRATFPGGRLGGTQACWPPASQPCAKALAFAKGDA